MFDTLQFAEMQAQLPGTSAAMSTRPAWMTDAGPLDLLVEASVRQTDVSLIDEIVIDWLATASSRLCSLQM